jgi:hypothetical protein
VSILLDRFSLFNEPMVACAISGIDPDALFRRSHAFARETLRTLSRPMISHPRGCERLENHRAMRNA